MNQHQLPPSEPIPPGFGPATPPWVWKVTYGLLGMLVGTIIVVFAVTYALAQMETHDRERSCWDPPPEARRWAYPMLLDTSSSPPLVCARKMDNNDGVMPYAHRCRRMVPCEDL